MHLADRIASVEEARSPGLTERANAEATSSSNEMVAVLHCCTAIDWLHNDFA